MPPLITDKDWNEGNKRNEILTCLYNLIKVLKVVARVEFYSGVNNFVSSNG